MAKLTDKERENLPRNDLALPEQRRFPIEDTAHARNAKGCCRRPGGDDTNHLYGMARMGDDPKTSVVDGDCRSWDIPNLWVCDGSVFPTTGGVNPSLTIQAIALRTADRIKALAWGGALRGV